MVNEMKKSILYWVDTSIIYILVQLLCLLFNYNHDKDNIKKWRVEGGAQQYIKGEISQQLQESYLEAIIKPCEFFHKNSKEKSTIHQ